MAVHAAGRAGSPPRQRLQAAQRKDRLMAEALRVFAAKGYAATSMGDIARGAGVARSVLYDHFPSKRALFLEVLREQAEGAVAYVGSLVGTDAPTRQRMHAAIAAYFAYARENPAAWRLLFDRSRESDPEIREMNLAVHRTGISLIQGVLAADFERAGVDPASAAGEALAELLVGALDGATQWWERHPDTPPEELVDAATDLLWNGLGRA